MNNDGDFNDIRFNMSAMGILDIDNNLMEKFKESFKHLKKDPIMKTLIEKLGDKITLYDRKDEDLAKAISQLIIEQQVSFKAAITIKKRFEILIKDLSYKEVLLIENEKLKSIGISYRKVEYIKNVYSYFLKTSFNFYLKNLIHRLYQIQMSFFYLMYF